MAWLMPGLLPKVAARLYERHDVICAQPRAKLESRTPRTPHNKPTSPKLCSQPWASALTLFGKIHARDTNTEMTVQDTLC